MGLHDLLLWQLIKLIKKVKLPLCLTSYALFHKDMREWRYSSTILDLGTRWKLSGHLHALAASPTGKELPVPIG
jgi:hypothetical protein